jgi:hypothetical protein
VSAPFVAQLRARPGVVRLGAAESVIVLKAAALTALQPNGDPPDAFVMKLNGFEVLDEGASLSDVGAKNGSTFLVTYRRRRPVR